MRPDEHWAAQAPAPPAPPLRPERVSASPVCPFMPPAQTRMHACAHTHMQAHTGGAGTDTCSRRTESPVGAGFAIVPGSEKPPRSRPCSAVLQEVREAHAHVWAKPFWGSSSSWDVNVTGRPRSPGRQGHQGTGPGGGAAPDPPHPGLERLAGCEGLAAARPAPCRMTAAVATRLL